VDTVDEQLTTWQWCLASIWEILRYLYGCIESDVCPLVPTLILEADSGAAGWGRTLPYYHIERTHLAIYSAIALRSAICHSRVRRENKETPNRRRATPEHTATMASRAAIPFLVTMMLLTGVCNTLLTKYQVIILSFFF
jgi:hypothetical protein